jgi:phosphonate transport system permease protein
MTRSSPLFNNLTDIETRHAGAFKTKPWARFKVLLTLSVLIGLLIFGLASLEFSAARIWNGIGQLGFIAGLMMPPDPGTIPRLIMYVLSLAETLAIAFLGTGLACFLAFPLALLAARNVTTQRLLQFMTRRSLDVIRGVDTLIWALIWINVVGLGPFAGVLAIMSSDIGAFGKLFSEAFEAADPKPVEGVLASGGTHAQAVRFGLIPQILPIIASQWLYYFESNTRSATIIGIVGAGGIGLHLSEMIRTLEWQAVSFLVLMVLVTVSLIDALSSKIRSAIIGPRAH